MEDLGEKFLEELIDRSLVQVSRRDYTGTNVQTCRVHDLLRDLCTKKAREEKFLEIIQQPLHELEVTLAESMLRRISIHPSKSKVYLKGEHPKLRSLLFSQNEKWVELCISKYKSFKFLRVLTLAKTGDGWWHVSTEIGNLQHLRYLKLYCDSKMILPRSIGRLKNLYTLYIKCFFGIVIPDGVFKLERLRHIVIKLEGLFPVHRFRWLQGFTSKNIETLKFIEVDGKAAENNAVLRWTNIQSLGIEFTRAEYVKPTLILLAKLQRLRSVSLRFSYSTHCSQLDLEPLSQYYHLSKLKLLGPIEDEPLPNGHVLKFLPSNIVKLTLVTSKLSQDPMAVLEKLCHLRILYMEQAYIGSKIVCSANGFPKLDYLRMSCLLKLKKWEIEEGAMPCLRELKLLYVESLRMLPEGLRYITTLQELNLRGMPSSLVKRIKVIDGREGEDFYKVRHIPSIHII
ncbi:hypothetical protein Gotur_024495 [Gossypium turneri]